MTNQEGTIFLPIGAVTLKISDDHFQTTTEGDRAHADPSRRAETESPRVRLATLHVARTRSVPLADVIAGPHSRPCFFPGDVPNVTGASHPLRYEDRATTTGDARAMTERHSTVQCDRLGRTDHQSAAVDDTRTLSASHRAAAPTQKAAPQDICPREARNADARRGAYKALKNAGKLPDIKPDDVSVTDLAGITATEHLRSGKGLVCSAAAPVHAVLDRTREGLRQYAGYFPNAFGIAFRAWSASFVETVRSTCLGPYDPAARRQHPPAPIPQRRWKVPVVPRMSHRADARKCCCRLLSCHGE